MVISVSVVVMHLGQSIALSQFVVKLGLAQAGVGSELHWLSVALAQRYIGQRHIAQLRGVAPRCASSMAS